MLFSRPNASKAEGRLVFVVEEIFIIERIL